MYTPSSGKVPRSNATVHCRADQPSSIGTERLKVEKRERERDYVIGNKVVAITRGTKLTMSVIRLT